MRDVSPPGSRVEVYRDAGGKEWRWRGVSRNNETVATGEAHSRRWSAKRAARAVFPDWPVIYIKETPLCDPS